MRPSLRTSPFSFSIFKVILREVHHVTDSVDFGGQLLFTGDLLLQVIHGSAPAGFTVEQVLGQHSQFLQSAHGQSLICGFLFAH